MFGCCIAVSILVPLIFGLLLFLQIDNRSSKSVPIVITVIVVMLLSIAAGVVFVKKYVCGGRLVYLYLVYLYTHTRTVH